MIFSSKSNVIYTFFFLSFYHTGLFFLNFAYVPIIGDNVDTEKSAILMLNSLHCACSI